MGSPFLSFLVRLKKVMILTQRIGDGKTHSISLSWNGRPFAPTGYDLLWTLKADPATETDAQAKVQKRLGYGITVSGSNALVSLIPIDTAGGTVPGDGYIVSGNIPSVYATPLLSAPAYNGAPCWTSDGQSFGAAYPQNVLTYFEFSLGDEVIRTWNYLRLLSVSESNGWSAKHSTSDATAVAGWYAFGDSPPAGTPFFAPSIAATVQSLSPRTYYWDIQAKSNTNADDVRTVASGTLVLLRDVGRLHVPSIPIYVYHPPSGGIAILYEGEELTYDGDPITYS